MANEDVFFLGIKILIVNSEGRVLLLLRSPSEINRCTLWDIPGGRIQRGEDIAETLKRELYEETGLQIERKDVQFVGSNLTNSRIPLGKANAGLIFFVYKCKWDEIPEVRLSSEHCDFWWATPDEARKALQSSHIPPNFILAKKTRL
ncbi:MAG: NUDIX hydrolase [Nitrososphaera sp.]|nr:NUDIX hydrolase [Nitrososphaera sp.]